MDLKDLIYKAQCFRNIEPIEYMVPYPNLRGLIVGQNIKYGDQIVYKNADLKNRDVLHFVNQTANWLESLGVKPEHRILIYDFEFPYAELITFAIWSVGATVVITDEKATSAIDGVKPNFTLDGNEIDLPKHIDSFSKDYVHSVNRLLPDEALVFWTKDHGIRLSHYNLLVNTNGFYRISGLNEEKSFFTNLAPTTTAWIIFQVILPFYSGAILSEESPDLIIGQSGQFSNADHELVFSGKEDNNGESIPIYIQPENTAILSIGKDPNHMTEIKTDKIITGHSVMMGYLDEDQNRKVFSERGLKLTV